MIYRYINFNIKYYLCIIFLVKLLNLLEFSTNKVYAKNYIIKNVIVQKDYNLNFHKQEVFDKGFKQSFEKLFFKIVTKKDQKKINEIDLEQIKTMIENFSIKDEQFVDKKYICNFEVEFNKKKIINFLNNLEITPSVPEKTDVLFIPILINVTKNELLYYNQNPFYNKWNDYKQNYHLINYNLPNQDIEDFSILQKNLQNIENYDFKEILSKYDFKKIITLIIYDYYHSIRMYSKVYFDDQIFLLNKSYLIDKENLDSNLFGIIEELKNVYEDTWKSTNQINTSITTPIKIKINSENYSLSIKFEELLDDLDLIDTYSVNQINSDLITYRIIYNNLPEKFFKLLKSKNFNIQSKDNFWIIK